MGGNLHFSNAHPFGFSPCCQALAPNAETYFYSFGGYNPNDNVNHTNNEGFLDYLLYVQNQTYPPLVHSLSYGDVEAEIFNATQNGTIQVSLWRIHLLLFVVDLSLFAVCGVIYG